MKRRNKIFAGILMTGLIAVSGLGLVGCGGNQTQSDFNSVSEVYGFAGATTSLLSNSDAVSATMLSAQNQNEGLEQIKKNFRDAVSSTLDKYMNVFDSVIGGTKPVDVSQAQSDKQEYAHKLSITVSSIDGNENTCVMYFNETLKDGGAEVEDTDDEERETLLEGEMYFNGSATPLYLKGEKELDPVDNELEVVFKAMYEKDNEQNMIVFSQEKEIENGKMEEEYFFDIVVGGNSVYNFSFDLEKRDGKIEVEYEQEIAGAKISFEIEKKQDKIIIETSDFFGIQDLRIEVSVVKDELARTEHYVYAIPTWNLTFDGADRTVV